MATLISVLTSYLFGTPNNDDRGPEALRLLRGAHRAVLVRGRVLGQARACGPGMRQAITLRQIIGTTAHTPPEAATAEP